MPQKTILIAEDDAALAQAISVRCRSLGIEVKVSPNGLHAFGTILREPPDVLIVDVSMPGTDGLSLCEELSRDARIAGIPAIVLTGMADATIIQRCESLGAHYVWKGLDTWEELRPLLTKLLKLEENSAPVPVPERNLQPAVSKREQSTPPRVLVVDDDADVIRALQVRLSNYGIEVAGASSGSEGYWAALRDRPDVVVTDYTMPDGLGNYLIGKLKSHPQTQATPVIVLTGRKVGCQKDYGNEREMRLIGAAAYLTKPLVFGELLKELSSFIPIAEPIKKSKLFTYPF